MHLEFNIEIVKILKQYDEFTNESDKNNFSNDEM